MAWKLSNYKFSVRTPQGPENTAVVPFPVEADAAEAAAQDAAAKKKKKGGKKKSP